MEHISLTPRGSIGADFVPREFLPAGLDEHYLRNSRQARAPEEWRNLRSSELELLVKNGNYAEDWDKVLVTDQFDPRQIRNSQFFGLVRIGRLGRGMLEHHDLRVMTGITNSKVIACDIGDDNAVHNVRYLAHYILGSRVVLINIDEMHTTNYAKFGNGILKEGEDEEVRVWLDLMNETGGRQVLPFEEIITADAYLWAKYRDDPALQEKLKVITQDSFDTRRGYYGTVDDQSIIKNTRIIKDVKIGSFCYIKGANKLKNLTIKSTEEEPSQIGEGVELVNGIIGLGCHIFYGCKAVRFITGNNTNLKYGARLLNSFLGDNSTVSCCEILNNLIFPAHEQHHNNSFLVAACTHGQSNIAAGATIGSNHNSRANDNEIEAGRGFWPGLCASLKHSSRFASFVLIAKGNYPAELDISLPFSLVNNNVTLDRLEVMPGYWWLYNMYALARNNWKYQVRDKRKTKVQNIEFDCLAPDTTEEIRRACGLLEEWAGNAADPAGASSPVRTELPDSIELPGGKLERAKRKTVILKAREGYSAYLEMLWYYGVKNVLAYLDEHPDAGYERMTEELGAAFHTEWVNLGGQLVPEEEVRKLRADIASGALDSWPAIHNRYDSLWQAYPLEKQRHAFAVLRGLLNVGGGAGATDSTSNPPLPSREQLLAAFERASGIQRQIRDKVYASRKKDYDNPFRKMTYRNDAEMEAVAGTIDANSFIRQVGEETEEFGKRIEAAKQRI